MTPVIHAATEGGLHIIGAEPRVELEGSDVAALATVGDGRWAIVDVHEVWRNDGAGAWEQVASVPDRRLNCLLPVADDVLIGTSEAHLLRLRDGHADPVPGVEAAEGRTAWHTPWGGPPDVRSLATDRAGTLYANVHVGGILRSEDGGSTWRPTIPIEADVHEVRAPRDDLLLAAVADGLALSRDRGASWSYDAANLHARYSRAVGLADETILLSASRGPRGGQVALYRRAVDAPGSFERCTTGLPEWFDDNIDSGCLATNGSAAAFGTGDGRVFLSEDSGISWRLVASDLPRVRAVLVANA